MDVNEIIKYGSLVILKKAMDNIGENLCGG